MIKLLRSIIKTFTRGVHNTFTGTGRAGESLSGMMVQHYGFSSVPPAGIELITLQYGNNNISVAENDGSGKTNTIARLETNLPEGSVAIYTPMQDNNDNTLVILLKPGDTPIIYVVAEGGQVDVGADNMMIQVDDKTRITDISATPLPTYALVNVNWLTQQFAVHTHPVSGTVTLAPNPGVLPVLPESTTKLESA